MVCYGIFWSGQLGALVSTHQGYVFLSYLLTSY